MINFKENVFQIDTRDTSYILRVDENKQVVFEYYGDKISVINEYDSVFEKWPFAFGSSVIYDEKNPGRCLDLLSLECTTPGKGYFNEHSLILKTKRGFVSDFTFKNYEIKQKITNLKILPVPHGFNEELVITLEDKIQNITAELHYFVSEESNVICRNIIIKNESAEEIIVKKAMSMTLSLIDNDYDIVALYGGWINEGSKEIIPVKHGTFKMDSKTGYSSSRHNPFFMLKENKASENHGNVYAFNLIYSGNHLETIEKTNYGKVIISNGINDHCFDYHLKKGKSFITPLSVLTFSSKGMNGASQNMHDFVNNNVVPQEFANQERPILINNWEATYFKFNESKILSIAKKAKKAGVELFVLDDGWFSNRNNDSAGLGDYDVNIKKIPSSLSGLAQKINEMGLKFGLWFEPEMVNEDSKLYKEHPEYAIKLEGIEPSKGRNQLVLDYTKKEVREYVINALDETLKSANIEYVKWDCNRNISDFPLLDEGSFFYDYIIGLYEVLKLIKLRHSKVLFEGCSSGGNRFDLGILSYMNQNWASDDTDGYQRMIIQSGLALGYPLSTISAHVSSNTSHQLLRKTSMDTRFNISSFGTLGYEFDLNNLDGLEFDELQEQIEFYKEHRNLLQYGKFYQLENFDTSNNMVFEVLSPNKEEAIIGIFNKLQEPNGKTRILKGIDFIPDAKYEVKVRPQKHNIKEFGGLINMISPIRLKEEGKMVNFISHHKKMDGEKESYIVSGSMLNAGCIKLTQQWTGVGFNDEVRVMGDFGSRLYYIKKVK